MKDTDNGLQEEFDKQLVEFLNDKSERESYKRFKPIQDKILVKLFKFVPSDNNKGKIGTTSILTKSSLTGEWKPNEIAINEKIYPICKVIRVGKGVRDIDEDILYTVPYTDIVGDDWNPEFLFLTNTFGQQGNKGQMVKMPENMRQRIPKIEKNWDRYKFSLPDRIGDETDEDRLIYLIPYLKLEAEYELDK